jgi:hypothetical protein
MQMAMKLLDQTIAGNPVDLNLFQSGRLGLVIHPSQGITRVCLIWNALRVHKLVEEKLRLLSNVQFFPQKRAEFFGV